LVIFGVLFIAAFWAGAQNALAGGGSFITLPALIFSGLDARAANITSTIALFPGQVTTGLVGREHVEGSDSLTFKAFMAISLIGGALGACLLLATPASFFARLVPWLVLFATLVFGWGSFIHKSGQADKSLGRVPTALMQFAISIYGGYFGGGIGFLMLAGLTVAGLTARKAGATKNVLASAMNASAVLVFIVTTRLDWQRASVVAIGAIGGGFLGGHMLKRVNETVLRVMVILIGIVLTIGLFLKAAA
jgi:uncharacterized protein